MKEMDPTFFMSQFEEEIAMPEALSWALCFLYNCKHENARSSEVRYPITI
jgi:hypothetical protein